MPDLYITNDEGKVYNVDKILMLNLTTDKITLLADSGETTEIQPSGYVAHVETKRRKVGSVPPGGQRVAKALGTPIIEEAPTEIVVDSVPDANVQQYRLARLKLATDSSELLLVTREVAEAAHALGHPLWRRMVWLSDGVHIGDYDEGFEECRALRRVPQGTS